MAASNCDNTTVQTEAVETLKPLARGEAAQRHSYAALLKDNYMICHRCGAEITDKEKWTVSNNGYSVHLACLSGASGKAAQRVSVSADCCRATGSEPLSKSADGCAVAARWSDPAALKQYLMSAWIEAEAIIVTAEQLGKVPEVLMIFKAREMLREILHVLNAETGATGECDAIRGGVTDKAEL